MSNRPVVFISGASSGLGKRLVNRFLKAGFSVFATQRAPHTGHSENVVWRELDITDYGQCEAAIDAAYRAFGRLDLLINNASSFVGEKSIDDFTQAEIDQELSVTLRGAVYLSSLYCKRVRQQGHGKIVFISSTAGLAGEPGSGLFSTYAAAKAALLRFTECLNEDGQTWGLQAHVVAPCNMRDTRDLAKLMDEQAISYADVADYILGLVHVGDNLCAEKTVLRAARSSGKKTSS